MTPSEYISWLKEVRKTEIPTERFIRCIAKRGHCCSVSEGEHAGWEDEGGGVLLQWEGCQKRRGRRGEEDQEKEGEGEKKGKT